jgi:MATE family multidrug resistance protein
MIHLTAQPFARHPFQDAPNRTVALMTIPVTLSLLAEPISGMVDTAFIARLGAPALAALGVGTTALTTVFWAFNFLGISTQTEVAKAYGAGQPERAGAITSMALVMGVLLSLPILLIFGPLAVPVTESLGARGEVQSLAIAYLHWRLLGVPAVLLAGIGFGALRGLQIMRLPLWISIGMTAVNLLLNGPLIFGFGPIPALGVGGAALATSISQWVGALWVIAVVVRRLGFTRSMRLGEMGSLLKVGGNLFVRTGLLTLFVLIGTRVANQISAEAGAAHQAIRSVWLMVAYGLDGFAVTAQSLVGYFLGARLLDQGRRAARISMFWGLGAGALTAVAMIVATPLVAALFVPASAVAIFVPSWIIASAIKPLSGVAFVSDGTHWGTADYAYLRNVMLLATVVCGGAILLPAPNLPGGLAWIWIMTGVFLGIRTLFGIARIWPGLGVSPLRPAVETGEVAEARAA